MGLLAALITFAPRPLYEPHLATTWPWDLSPLEDQQLGGLFIWVPGCAAVTLVGLASIAMWLRRLGNGDGLTEPSTTGPVREDSLAT
jgi:putative membrane protein